MSDKIKLALSYIKYWCNPERGEMQSSVLTIMEKAVRLVGLDEQEEVILKEIVL
jgi:hypothetical protein